jgi:hypothetical protein
MQEAADEFDVREAYPLIDAVMRADDALDRTLADYQRYNSVANAS